MTEEEIKHAHTIINMAVCMYASTGTLPPLNNPGDYKVLLDFISLMMPEDLSPESDRGKFFQAMIEKLAFYEKEHFHFNEPTPEEMETFRQENMR